MVVKPEWQEVTEMNMPGFTAEVTLYKRSARYYQKAGDVNRAGILPALRIDSPGHTRIRNLCRQHGGTYWSEGKTTATYGCMLPNGSGIVCGGVTSDQKNTCDTF